MLERAKKLAKYLTFGLSAAVGAGGLTVGIWGLFLTSRSIDLATDALTEQNLMAAYSVVSADQTSNTAMMKAASRILSSDNAVSNLEAKACPYEIYIPEEIYPGRMCDIVADWHFAGVAPPPRFPATISNSTLDRLFFDRADISFLVILASSLRYVTFLEAELTAVTFEHSDMRDAEFIRTSLMGTSFRQVNLSNANLSQVNFDEVFFEFADISNAVLCSSDCERIKRYDWSGVFYREGHPPRGRIWEGLDEVSIELDLESAGITLVCPEDFDVTRDPPRDCDVVILPPN